MVMRCGENIFILLLVFGVLINVYPAMAGNSADSFNKFLDSSPNLKQNLLQNIAKEELSAACMSSAAERHKGVSLFNDGRIYSWVKAQSDDKEFKTFIRQDVEIVKPVFAMSDNLDWKKMKLDYEVNGTSYCYVRMQKGSVKNEILWPRNEIMEHHQVVPSAVKQLFRMIIDVGNVAVKK